MLEILTLFSLICLQAILTPILCLCYFLYKLNFIDKDRLHPCLNLDIPVNKLVAQYSSNVAFVVLIFIVLKNPIDIPCTVDPNFYDWLCAFMAIGQLVKNLEQMFLLTHAAPCYDGTVWRKNFVAKFLAFFGDSLYNYRLLGYILFMGGVYAGLGSV